MRQGAKVNSKGLVFLSVLMALFGVLLFNNLGGIRPWLYELSKQGANLYLNLQTQDYQTLEGENFSIKYSQQDENIAQFILYGMEEFYPKVQTVLRYKPAVQKKIPIVVYPDRAALNKSFGWGGDKSAVGVYWAGNICLLSPNALLSGSIDMDKLQEVYLREGPFTHELVHYLVDEMTRGNYSRWLTEGLAQYIERDFTGFVLAEPLPEEKKDIYSLTQLDRTFDQRPNQVLAYWQSLETVDYLIEQHGMEKMDQLLTGLGKGEVFTTAIQKVYDMSITELDEKMKQ
mgnify:CR=1 FL=1